MMIHNGQPVTKKQRRQLRAKDRAIFNLQTAKRGYIPIKYNLGNEEWIKRCEQRLEECNA